MRSVAVVDNRDGTTIAVWIIASVSALLVSNVNAVVVDTATDPRAIEKVRLLTCGRSVLLTRGSTSAGLPVDCEPRVIEDVGRLVARTEAMQQEILLAVADRRRKLAPPEFALVPHESDYRPAQDTPVGRALATANYLGRAWSVFLQTDDERRKRIVNGGPIEVGTFRSGPSFDTRDVVPAETESSDLGMLNFTAIDFETANSYRGSPCQVGLVRVRNGVVVDESKLLIRPPQAVDHFDRFNISLHGITPAMVADAPRWRDLLPRLVDYIADDIVVTHNAGFDVGVIRSACAAENVAWPTLRFVCSLVMARKALRLPSYRLPFVVDALGLQMGDHHDALADSRAVVDITCALARRQGANSVEALAESLGMCVGRMSAGLYEGSVVKRHEPGGEGFGVACGRLIRPELNPAADPDGHLYGRTVVFTGTLMSMTRQIAWEECARVGAVSEATTTKRTNVLVIGDINPASLRPGAELTDKAARAFALQANGQDIEVMTEDDFLRCIDGKQLRQLATSST